MKKYILLIIVLAISVSLTNAAPTADVARAAGTVIIDNTQSSQDIEITNANVVVSEEKPTSSPTLNIGDTVTFFVGGSAHTIMLKSLAGGVVVITVASTPFDVELRINNPTYLDVDTDGDNDIIVTVLEILTASSARFKIDYLAAAAKTTDTAIMPPPPTPSIAEAVPPLPSLPSVIAPTQTAPSKATPKKLQPNALVGIVLVIIIVVFLGFQYRQSEEGKKQKRRRKFY
ncbi:TPA: hypothetical protein H1005_00360 [archaeon]|uniref:Uncharacterized protein n=1 Tax=Candidatus Naiadarchaeum limnaeum TaxID=2756139 RepID=A0A832XLS4_9ARCH|nr:hypothetical protein [Candidatus Naiadarchaeales archaeon SRR2090153.bin1042]HIK00263.1 hypothetical protein [Candidatus Naiadarchaeum limnaeum]